MISDRCIFCFESQVRVGVCLSCGAFSPVAPELFECLGLPSLRIEKLDDGNIDLQQTCLAACAFADPASWGGFIAFPRKVMLRACLASFIRASFLTEADWGGKNFYSSSKKSIRTVLAHVCLNAENRCYFSLLSPLLKIQFGWKYCSHRDRVGSVCPCLEGVPDDQLV